MKTLFIFGILLMGSLSFAQTSNQKTFDCSNSDGSVWARLVLTTDTTGTLFMTGFPQVLSEVKADRNSSPANYVFVAQDQDLALAQDHFNTISVFIIDRESIKDGRDTTARFEDRDYDDDYDAKEYRTEEKGPSANPYVVRGNGPIEFKCTFLRTAQVPSR